MSKIINLIGKKFGRLTVLSRSDNKVLKSGAVIPMWLCKCSCGSLVTVQGNNLRNLKTLSCGCLQKEKASACKHGQARRKKNSRLYGIWCGIKSRCYNKNNKSYKYYGERGISVCKEWQQFEAFMEWAMANNYSHTLTIDRINVNGNYEPSNCRWVTRKEQSQNTRENHYITFNNTTKTLTEWSECKKIPAPTILARLKRGWSVEKTLTTQPRMLRKINKN